MTDPETLVSVKELRVDFEESRVLNDINFSVKRGEVLAIVGPNGAGKSTLFKAMLGLVPYTGSIVWAPKVRIGYVPQKINIEAGIPLNVREFFGLKTKSLHKAHEALAQVGIKATQTNEHHFRNHLLKRSLQHLSGGELQRVLIAWALIDMPDVLLFDEPTAGVDIGGEQTIYNLLHELQDQHGLTILLISHDLQVVYRHANSVLCLNRKQICFGEPHDILDKKSINELYGSNEVSLFHFDHKHPHHD